jgi:hypothetical protein
MVERFMASRGEQWWLVTFDGLYERQPRFELRNGWIYELEARTPEPPVREETPAEAQPQP